MNLSNKKYILKYPMIGLLIYESYYLQRDRNAL